MDATTAAALASAAITTGFATWFRFMMKKVNGAPSASDFKELRDDVKQAIMLGNENRKELWVAMNDFKGEFKEFKGRVEAKLNGR